MNGFLENLIIGLISGLLSGIAAGFVVNVIWASAERKRLAKKEAAQDRARYLLDCNDKRQAICRYLDRLQLELELKNSTERHENILRVMKEHPYTPGLSDALTPESKALLIEIRRVEERIADRKTPDEAQYAQDRQALFRLEYQFLKAGDAAFLDWEVYRQSR